MSININLNEVKYSFIFATGQTDQKISDQVFASDETVYITECSVPIFLKVLF